MNTKKQTAYVAIPYSYDPASSFDYANRASAYLIEQGYVVISPISQSHPIADYLDSDLRKDSDFWLEQDLPLLEKCDVLVLVYVGYERIKESKGCQAELKFAMENNIAIKLLQISPYMMRNLTYEEVKEFCMPKKLSIKEQYIQDTKDFLGYVNFICKGTQFENDKFDAISVGSLISSSEKEINYLQIGIDVTNLKMIAVNCLVLINKIGSKDYESFKDFAKEHLEGILNKIVKEQQRDLSENPFESFINLQEMNIVSVEVGFLKRINYYFKKSLKCSSLTVLEQQKALLEVIENCILLYGYMRYKKNKENGE